MPKDGGNRFSGSFFLYGQGSSLQADNRSDAVKAAGITIAGTAYDWQINPSFGGPLAKDKLWFYFTYKLPGRQGLRPQCALCRRQPSVQKPDGQLLRRRPAHLGGRRARTRSASTSRSNSTASSTTASTRCRPARPRRPPTPSAAVGFPQIRWTRAQSNKLLLEAGIAYYNQPYEQNCRASVKPTDLPSTNFSTGLLSGACGYTIPPYSSTTKDYSTMASASYVTGSHAVKVGMTDGWGENSRTFAPNANIDTLIKINTTIPGLGAVTDFPFSGRGLQLTGDRHPEREQRLRQLRPGHLDDEAVDAELRRAVRALQRLGSGGILAGVDLDRRA